MEVGSLATTAALLLLLLALLGLAAFVVAWLGARLVRQRREEAAAAGRRGKSWGGRDYERVRSKYFAKEARARAVRARHHQAQPPPRIPREEASAPVSNLEYFHRETLQLIGVELTPDVLRDTYRRRIREYHPDRVAGMGLKIRVLAEEETKRINEAYRFLLQRIDADVE